MAAPKSAFEAAVASSIGQGSGVELSAIAQDVNQGSSFNAVDFDLDTLTVPKTFSRSGAQLLYLRRGSHPGGRLDVRLGGSVIKGFRPGSRIVAPFQSFNVARPRQRGAVVSTSGNTST